MAAYEEIQNIHDLSLKPRLLRWLLREYVPDEKHPFRNPSDLSHAVSVVKTHRLLSESDGPSPDPKLIDQWKSAVEVWINRVLNLVSSDTPDKCWAGICMLGVTCQECNSERFLASYSVWYSKLLLHIQSPSDSHFVKVASCNSVSDLCMRLSGFANVKKDAMLQVAKLIHPVLKLLNEDNSDAVWEGSLLLLCTILTHFPSSLRQHYDGAEAAIVSKIMSGKCGVDLLKKLGHCLALLPKSRGDEETWVLMMQKILFSMNAHLKDLFQSLEEEGKNNEFMRVLFPPGKDPPPPLGGPTIMGESSDQEERRPERLLISSVSTLMFCCSKMLENSYPLQVAVPVRPIIFLIQRVLMVDGSLSQALFPYLNVMQQEFIFSELPALHLYSLDLLTAVIKGLRSQLLPHAADIVRLLVEYLRRCALPNLRIKVYYIIKILLMSLGVGIAICLAQDVVHNACIDLDFNIYERDATSSAAHSKISSNEALTKPEPRKRKHTNPNEQHDRVGLELEILQNLRPISVKIAALQALEALLTVSGALRSENWRQNIDFLLITVAKNAFRGGWAKEEHNIFLSSEPSSTWADFQLAALHALLASLLSPSHVRPPYLAHGLELFRRGMQEVGTEIAEFCAHALLALEVLIHPRALPLVDFSNAIDNSFDGVGRQYPEYMNSNGHRQNTTFPVSTFRKEPSEPESNDDDLYESWIKNGDEIELSPTHQENNRSYAEEPLEKSEQGVSAVGDAKRIEDNGDLIMVESQQHQEASKPSEEQISNRAGMVSAVSGGSLSVQSDTVGSEGTVLDTMDCDMASGKDLLAIKSGELTIGEKSPAVVLGKDVLATKDDGIITAVGKISDTLNTDIIKGFPFELENEPSMEFIPDIVDGDPDSD